mgnify:CR=1 FL=1
MSTFNPISFERPRDLKQYIKEMIATYGAGVSLRHVDVSKMVWMSNVFRGLDFQGDISNWDVSSLISMKTMFSKSIFNGDISRWDVSKVQYMLGTFEHSQFSGDISKWDISHVRIFHGMFFGSSFNGDISNWKLNPRVQASAVLKNTDNYDADRKSVV